MTPAERTRRSREKAASNPEKLALRRKTDRIAKQNQRSATKRKKLQELDELKVCLGHQHLSFLDFSSLVDSV